MYPVVMVNSHEKKVIAVSNALSDERIELFVSKKKIDFFLSHHQ